MAEGGEAPSGDIPEATATGGDTEKSQSTPLGLLSKRPKVEYVS